MSGDRRNPLRLPISGSTALAYCVLAGAGAVLGVAANEPQAPRLLVLGLAALASALLVWVKPNWAGLVLLFLLFSRLSDPIPPIGGSLTVNQLLVALFLMVMLARQVASRRPLPVTDPLLAWLLAYGAMIGLSSFGAEDPSIVVASLAGYLRDVLILFLLLNMFRSSASLRAASWTLILAGVVLAGAAAVYGSTGYDFGGLTGEKITPVVGQIHRSRLSAHLGDPNDFAHLLVTLVPLALYRLWDERRPVVRAAALSALSLLCGVIIWTYSRGGFVALLAVLGLALTMRRFKPAYLVLMGLALVPVALTAPPLFWGRIGSTVHFLAIRAPGLLNGAEPDGADWNERLGSALATEDQDGQAPDANPNVTAGDHPNPVGDLSLSDRSRLWRVGGLMFLEHPLAGVGKGDYLPLYAEYAWRVDPALPLGPMVAHFTPIQIAAETGLIGLATFTTLIVVALREVRSARRRLAAAGREREAMCLEALEIAIYGYLVASLFLTDTMRPLWLLLGLVMVGRQACLRSASVQHNVTPRPAPVMASA